ncbi:MAG: matrixin family metalloprotease [Deltaproteobacteria bacterium]|nr:matrixin family metalloprotease [Deltaproteobacteria bacterium]
MNCQGRLFSLLAVLLLVVSGCAKDNSKNGNGNANGWSSFPVTIYAGANVVSSPAAVSDMNDAMKFWEAKAGRKLFDYKGTWAKQSAPYTGTAAAPGTVTSNVLMFQSPWPYAPNLAGVTTVNTTGTQIDGAVVMINASTPLCTGDCIASVGDTSERKTFAHELGHFLGLAHVQDPANIMYPQIQAGGSLDNVIVDDAALQSLTSGN